MWALASLRLYLKFFINYHGSLTCLFTSFLLKHLFVLRKFYPNHVYSLFVRRLAKISKPNENSLCKMIFHFSVSLLRLPSQYQVLQCLNLCRSREHSALAKEVFTCILYPSTLIKLLYLRPQAASTFSKYLLRGVSHCTIAVKTWVCAHR